MKNKNVDFINVPAHIIMDSNISNGSKMVYLSMLVIEDISTNNICKHMKISKNTCLKYIKELVDNGYLFRTQKRDFKNRFLGIQYIIFKL